MAGYNQQGPMNEGPMTGRGRGSCTGTQSAQEFGSRNSLNEGRMMGQGRGRRQCQPRGRGMGFGQQLSVPEPVLQNKIDNLEAELTALKMQLQKISVQTNS